MDEMNIGRTRSRWISEYTVSDVTGSSFWEIEARRAALEAMKPKKIVPAKPAVRSDAMIAIAAASPPIRSSSYFHHSTVMDERSGVNESRRH